MNIFRVLIILSSLLVVIHASCPSGAAQGCTCDSEFNRVKCLNIDAITSIPAWIPKDTKYLRFTKCSIKSITNDSFANLTSLVEIDLDEQKSGLSVADSAVFQGLKDLETVRLSGNKLATVPSGLFANLTKLKTVDLGNNRLSTLPDDLFTNSPNVETLNLYSTQLLLGVPTKIGRGDFGQNIITLALAGTHITRLNAGFFSGLPKLKNLGITDCSVNYIAEDILKGTQVDDVNFGGNPLKHVDANAFRGDSPAVKSFKCEKCSLTSNITFGFIKNMKSLDSLHLRDNQLTTIPKDAFTDLTDLSLIDLRENSITTIEENPFAGLSKCHSDSSCIQLEGNPLNCDCKLAWLKEWSKKWSYVNQLRCKTPDKVFGKTFPQLKATQFCCSSGNKTKCGSDKAIITPTSVGSTTNGAWCFSTQLFVLIGIPLLLT